MDWTQVALVLAGSAGPLLITLVNLRSTRRLEAERWLRQATTDELQLYARFVGDATQVLTDWSDYATYPPTSVTEERAMDERRDTHYAELNDEAALVRLTAPPSVREAAERVLGTLRAAQQAAKAGSVTEAWAGIEADFAEAREAFIAAVRARPSASPSA